MNNMIKDRLNWIFLILVYCLCSTSVQSARYKSELLSSLGDKLGYRIEDGLDAGAYDIKSTLGFPTYVEYNSYHEVTNIGYKMFDPQLKQTLSPIVCDFLERYFLELSYYKDLYSLKRKTDDDKFVFIHGGMDSLKDAFDYTSFSLFNRDGKYYEAIWKKNGEEVFSVSFPIQYELLLGMPQIEIERTLYSEIKRTADYKGSLSAFPNLDPINDSVYVSGNKYFMIESLNTSTYYKKQGDLYSLLLDTSYVNFSLLNLLREPSLLNNPIFVEQRVYGFKTIQWEITLHDWINYFKKNDFIIYTAIEESYSNSAKVLFVAECPALGYNHVISLVVPYSILSNPSVGINADLTGFIPTHNVSELFQQYSKTRKKNY